MVNGRYRESSKKVKGRVLDEFVAVTGHHRKPRSPAGEGVWSGSRKSVRAGGPIRKARRCGIS